MRRAILTATLCLMAAPASADLGDYCLKAIGTGDEAGAKRLADMILFSNTQLPPERAAVSAECLKGVLGQDYVYAASTGKFEPASEHEVREAERRRKLAEQRDEERKAREVREDAAKSEAEAKARTEDLLAEMELRALEGQGKVVERLAEACRNLYQRHPDETITNRLCYDVFLNQGLPD